MKQKLIPERIISEEERPLSNEDIALLKSKRNKQLALLLSGYLPLIGCALYILWLGPYSIRPSRRFTNAYSDRGTAGEDDKFRFWTVAPWFVGIMFILATVYFARLYFQSIRPISRDIQCGSKRLLFFKPVKNPMAFFNKYYLSTPLYQNQQIQVSREDFDSISDNDELHIEVGPNSTHILRLCNGNKEISYY